MPATPTATSAERTIHARRTRMRRRNPGSAATEGTRSSGGSEGKSEESEVTAGLVSNNRFAVLRPREPAPGIREGRESSLPLDPIFRRERPITLPFQSLPTDEGSSSEKTEDRSLAPTFPATSFSKRSSIQGLASHKPAKSTRTESSRLAPAAAASISPTKPQAQPSPLALQADVQSSRSSKPIIASARVSPDSDTAAPQLSLMALPLPPIPPNPLPSPILATLPSPPIPTHPLLDPSLATLPLPPALDFKSLTSPGSSLPQPRQLAPPIPTSFDTFPSDDPVRHIVQTTSGRIFIFAAEIAAANTRSTMRPVGNVLVPGPANKFGKGTGKLDVKKSDHGCGEYGTSPEEQEEGEGEDWLGKEEQFWEQPFEEADVVKKGKERSREG